MGEGVGEEEGEGEGVERVEDFKRQEEYFGRNNIK